jgi:hypothetical protein
MKKIKTGKSLFFVLFITALSNLRPVLAQVAARDNKPAISNTSKEMPDSTGLFGVFEGRPPCQEMAHQINVDKTDACTHLKWRLMLFVDPVSRKPTVFTSELGLYGRTKHKGNWQLKKGAPFDPEAWIIVLDFDKPVNLYALGDDNVLLFWTGSHSA